LILFWKRGPSSLASLDGVIAGKILLVFVNTMSFSSGLEIFVGQDELAYIKVKSRNFVVENIPSWD